MAASVGYFIEYIMMHGTINIKEKLTNIWFMFEILEFVVNFW